MAQQIFYLCRCDEGKSRSSMIPILMTTDENKLIEAIKDEISQIITSTFWLEGL